MENKKQKVIIGVVIFITLVMSGTYIMGQKIKQESIERQQQIKIEAEQELLKLEAIAERKEKEAEEKQKRIDKSLYNACKEIAEREYWNYVELNMTSKSEDGSIRAEIWVWDRANDDKRQRIEDCKDLYLR
jgi:guanylate kinase